VSISIRTAAAGTGLAAAGTTIAITLPTTIALNDIIFLFVATGASTGNLTAPNFTEIVKVQAQSRTIWLAYKIALGTEGGTSVTVTDTNSNVKAGGALAFFGTEAGAPVFGFDPAVPTNGNGQINASSTTIATPQLTMARDCSRKVWFAATAATTAGGVPPAITRPGTFSNALAQVNATSTGNNMGVHIGHQSAGSAGPSGSVDGSAASACVNGGIFLALAERPCANDFEVAPAGTALSTGNTGGRSGVAFDAVTIGSGATLASDIPPAASAAPSVRATSTYVSAASDTSFNIALPSGWQAGDVCYIAVENRGTGAGVTTPSGWTAVAAVFNPFGQTNTAMGVYRRVLQAGDTSPVTFTVTSGRIAAVALAVQGADNATPEDGVTVAEAAQSAATNSPVASSVTSASASDLLLCFFGAGDPTTANVAMTFTQPSGMTLVVQASTAQAGATDAGVMAASLPLGAAGATGTQTATVTPSSGSVATNSQAVTLVVKSGAAPAGGAAIRGGYSLKCATVAAANSYAEWNVSATASTFGTQYVRFYVLVAALPTINTRLLTWFNALTTQAGGIIITATTGKIATLNGAGSTVQTCANALIPGQWARVEAFCLGSATVGQLELKLFLTPDAPLASPTETITSAATQNTAGAINAVRLGQGSAATVANYGPVWFDAFYVRDQVYPGPADPGRQPWLASRQGAKRGSRHRHLVAFR
jgi:hypothetical protein